MTSFTAVKVRGKKQSKSNPPVISQSTSTVEGKRARSLPDVFSLPSKRTRQALCVPTIENLPIEILEEIFFYCLNVSLPQASLVLGQKLASFHVKSQLTFRVLSSPSSIDYPCALAAIFPTLRDQAEVQSAVLRLKWMTLSFLKAVIPEYIIKTLVREMAARELPWMADGPVVSKACEPLIRQYLQENTYRSNGSDRFRVSESSSSKGPLIRTRGLPAYWETSWAAPHGALIEGCASRCLIKCPDSRRVHMGVSLREGLITLGDSYHKHDQGFPAKDSSIRFSRWRIINGVEGCRIPEKLLHGPWDVDKCEFLEIVIRGNATVDWVGTLSGEIAEEGLLQAIEECSARAVKALLARIGSLRQPLDSFATLYRVKSKLESSQYRELPVRRGVGIVPTTAHIRKAITGGCKEDVIEALLHAAETTIDPYDAMIHQWVSKSRKFDYAKNVWC